MTYNVLMGTLNSRDLLSDEWCTIGQRLQLYTIRLRFDGRSTEVIEVTVT